MTVLVGLFTWFLVILAASILISELYRVTEAPEVRIILNIVLFVGVVVHELAHASVMLCNRMMPVNFRVSLKSRRTGRTSPNGAVMPPQHEIVKLSFLQTFFIGLAPLFISTLVFFFMLDIVFNTASPDLIKVLAVIVAISVVFGSSPSGADLNLVAMSFKRRPEYSCFQVLLATISVLIVVFYVDLSFITLDFEVHYYILHCLAAMVIYGMLKGSILGTKALVLAIVHRLQERKEKPNVPVPAYLDELLAPEEEEW